jgi:hypothetical protein
MTAPLDAIEQAVLDADDARCRAMLAHDLAALSDLLDNGLFYTHSSGVTDTKAQYLDAMREGRVRYQALRRSEERFGRSGDVTAMAGRVQIEVWLNGELRTLENRFTTTWVLRGAKWRLMTWASTPLPKHGSPGEPT